MYNEECGLAKIWPNGEAEEKLLHWIATYPLGKITHPLNNWDLGAWGLGPGAWVETMWSKVLQNNIKQCRTMAPEPSIS